MADPLLTLFSLAGFLLAQVLAVSAEVPKTELTPVAFVATEQNQRFRFFEGDTLTEMVENGKRELISGKHEAWAFAYEGFVVVGNERKNVVLIHAWMEGVPEAITIAQPWERGADGKAIKVVGPPFVLSGFNLSGTETKTSVTPLALTEQQEKAIEAGMSRNRELRSQGAIGKK